MTDNRKTWNLRTGAAQVDSDAIKAFSATLGIDSFTANLLWNRDINDVDTAREYLTPSLKNLPRPAAMLNLQKAAKILGDAVQSGEPIGVFGDFDVDGMSGVSLLVGFMRQSGARTSWFVPSRLNDGYGLSEKGITNLFEQNIRHEKGPGVLVTVDCGISNTEEVNFAKSQGFSVVITDHHQPPLTLPEADAIVNPLQKGCDFPCKNLSGAGVAFYLAAAVRKDLDDRDWWQKSGNQRPVLKNSLDLVAMGTVGDNMKVTGANRIMVAAGLKTLGITARAGLKSLLQMSKIHGTHITTEDVAYRLAPRVNAAGRMGCEQTAVQLLLQKKNDKTQQLAAQLNKANIARQKIEQEVMSEALPLAQEQIAAGEKGVVVCGGWHKGVVGIVASRLNKEFNTPVIVFTEEKEGHSLRGSARSGNTINLVDIFSEISFNVPVEAYGGHAQAAGIELKQGNFDEFSALFKQKVEEKMERFQDESIMVDMLISPEEIFQKKLHASYQVMAPFGKGNPEPLFLAKDFHAHKVWVVQDKHLKVQFESQRSMCQGIGFNMAAFHEKFSSGPVDITYRPRRNYFRGRGTWEIQLLHVLS